MPKYLIANLNNLGSFSYQLHHDKLTDGNGKQSQVHFSKLLSPEDETLSLDQLILKFKHEVEGNDQSST